MMNIGSITEGFAIDFFKESLLDFLSKNETFICYSHSEERVFILYCNFNDETEDSKSLYFFDFVSLVIAGSTIGLETFGKRIKEMVEKLDENLASFIKSISYNDEKSSSTTVLVIDSDSENIFVSPYLNCVNFDKINIMDYVRGNLSMG